MRKDILKRKGTALCCALMLSAAAVPAYADTYDGDGMISDITVPEPSVIQYDVMVPAGSTVNYSVELTPDEKAGTIDKVSGMWKNTTNKTVTKTIKAKVKFLSSEYTISAAYTSNSTHQKLEYKDKAESVKSYEESALHAGFTWNSDVIGKWCGVMEKQLKKVSDFIK